MQIKTAEKPKNSGDAEKGLAALKVLSPRYVKVVDIPESFEEDEARRQRKLRYLGTLFVLLMFACCVIWTLAFMHFLCWFMKNYQPVLNNGTDVEEMKHAHRIETFNVPEQSPDLKNVIDTAGIKTLHVPEQRANHAAKKRGPIPKKSNMVKNGPVDDAKSEKLIEVVDVEEYRLDVSSSVPDGRQYFKPPPFDIPDLEVFERIMADKPHERTQHPDKQVEGEQFIREMEAKSLYLGEEGKQLIREMNNVRNTAGEFISSFTDEELRSVNTIVDVSKITNSKQQVDTVTMYIQVSIEAEIASESMVSANEKQKLEDPKIVPGLIKMKTEKQSVRPVGKVEETPKTVKKPKIDRRKPLLSTPFPKEAYLKAQVKPTPPAVLTLDLSKKSMSEDKSLKYFDEVLVGPKYGDMSQNHKTCLVTQCTVDMLPELMTFEEAWEGPMAVAVFVGDEQSYDMFSDFADVMVRCLPKLYSQTSFSLVFPARVPNPVDEKFLLKNRPCEKAISEMQSNFLAERNFRALFPEEEIMVPQNHLRNFAATMCKAEYQYVTDIDMVPRLTSVHLLDNFLQQQKDCEKCAFIVPAYEVQVDPVVPKDKRTLLVWKEEGKARPLHETLFPKSQSSTDYKKWEMLNDLVPGNITVAYDVTDFEIYYEPYYIAKTGKAPKYDEQFVGYGFTRAIQALQALNDGFKFKVVSPIFSVHIGMKTYAGWSLQRQKQDEKNMQKFDLFYARLQANATFEPIATTTTKKN